MTSNKSGVFPRIMLFYIYDESGITGVMHLQLNNWYRL